MSSRGLALALLVGVVPAAQAQTRFTEHTLRAHDSVPGPAATMAQTAWLAGRWLGEGLGATVEETWLPASGGTMAGVFRLTQGGQVRFYEIVTLGEEDASLVMRLKHFAPDLSGWESKDRSVSFRLLRAESECLWFEGLTMCRRGPDGLHVWVALEQAGEVHEALFTYRRAR